MLIPNKFNGYQADGSRILPIGGGVGEAMLFGAALGGGSAALTGGDPLKGALLGGLTGGAGAGVSGALANALGGTTASTLLSATAPEAATAATTAASAAAPTAGAGITSLLPQAATDATTAALTSAAPGTAPGITALPAAAAPLPGSAAYMNLEALNPAPFVPPAAPVAAVPTPAMSFDSFGSPVTAGSPAAMSADPTGLAQAQVNANAQQAASPYASLRRAIENPGQYIMDNKFKMGASALAGAIGGRKELEMPDDEYEGPLKRFKYNPDTYRPSWMAEGGIASLAAGGYDRMVGEMPMYQAMAQGGVSDLGTYSDGGRMLKGRGDGMSDSIPGVIGGKRPARLADGEFVVPADVVSHLGNGSTDAGAKQLYAMMDKVRTARTGRKAQGREINPRKYMPA